MAFIDNIRDNFLPSGNPWEDDNVSVYSDRLNRVGNLGGLEYPQLKSLFNDLDKLYTRMPVSFERNKLRNKLEAVWGEIKRRAKLEQETAKERDDNFEQPLEQAPKYTEETYEEDLGEPIEDVIGEPTQAIMTEDIIEREPLFTTPQDQILSSTTATFDEPEEEIEADIEVDDIEEQDSMMAGFQVNNLLLGSLLVLAVIMIVKK